MAETTTDQHHLTKWADRNLLLTDPYEGISPPHVQEELRRRAHPAVGDAAACRKGGALMAAVSILEDFPRAGPTGAVPGSHPKLLVREVEGQFMAAHSDTSALQRRFEVCDDLVYQLTRYSAGKREERPGFRPPEGVRLGLVASRDGVGHSAIGCSGQRGEARGRDCYFLSAMATTAEKKTACAASFPAQPHPSSACP